MTAANLVWSETLEFSHDRSQVAMSSPSFDLARAWTACEQRLYEISKLTDDWDGLGADAPDVDAKDTAFKFLGVLRARRDPPPHRIIASPEGSIVFEWQEEPGLRVEAEIIQRDLVEISRKEFGDEPIFSEELLGRGSVWDDIAWPTPLELETSAAA